MFKVTFSDVDKKILKSVKPLKSKKGHSLHEADELLKKAYEIVGAVDGKTKLAIVLNDVDNELNYIFENIIIDDLKEPNLLEILENEIISSGHENAQKIITEIQRSYQAEESNVNSTIPKGKGKKSKKPGFLKCFKKKKNVLEDEESQGQIMDDFAELEAATSIQDDFQEDDYTQEFNSIEENETQNPAFDDFKEIENQEDLDKVAIETFYGDSLDTNAEYETEETSYQDEGSETKETVEIDDDFQELSDEQKDYSLEQDKIYKRKNDGIVFPAYNSYLSLSQVENTVKRNKKRLEKENLIKFLGLNALSDNEVTTELDRKKLNYALNTLDDTEFISLKDQFHNEIEDIKDQTQSQLAEVYDQAMAYDYEGVAKEKLGEEYKDLASQTECVFNEYVAEQEKEYNLKLEKFLHEQEKALEEFKKQQALDKGAYINELDTKKSSRVELYQYEKQQELDNKKEKLLDEELFQLKNQYINQLTESKRISIRNLEAQLEETMDEVWGYTQEALNRLKKDIEKNIPSWKKDIKEKEEIEARKREEQRKEEELRIEKERIALQKRQLELKAVKEEKSKKETDDLVEKKFKEYDEKLNSFLKIQNENTYHQNIANQSKETNKEQSILSKIALPAITIAILVLGTGMFLGQGFNKGDSQTVAQMQYERLVESISKVEERLNTEIPEETSQMDDLDSLLKNKNYEKAMSIYKDSEDLEKIEETLYQNGDLAMLITFNKTNETTFGKFDEALLSDDIDKAIENYKKMPDDEKKNLSKDRKSDFALLLYQDGQKDLANKLLEK